MKGQIQATMARENLWMLIWPMYNADMVVVKEDTVAMMAKPTIRKGSRDIPALTTSASTKVVERVRIRTEFDVNSLKRQLDQERIRRKLPFEIVCD